MSLEPLWLRYGYITISGNPTWRCSSVYVMAIALVPSPGNWPSSVLRNVPMVESFIDADLDESHCFFLGLIESRSASAIQPRVPERIWYSGCKQLS